MPVRRRLGRVASLEIPSDIFAYGDGTWTYFSGEPVYPDRETARRAWEQCRREVWATEAASDIPGAAHEYDGLTRHGFATLWSTWNHKEFPLAEALVAIDEDRRAVRLFQEREPRGARAIADFLGIWLAYLDQLESHARELGALTEDGRFRSGIVHRFNAGRTYADTLRASSRSKETTTSDHD